ncbi:MAG: F0F1 ATP synthase subunit A [candidate division Zixibacteria bacterium]|nr:F0F1 ATP synthase subunit A [candidate division Zixibacteria bacterium]
MGSLNNFYCLVTTKLAPVMMAASGGEEGGHGGATHLPDAIGLFSDSHVLDEWKAVIFAFFIAAIFAFTSLMAYRKREMIPGPFQNFMEMLVEWMYNFLYSILGKDARQYTPFLGTLFFYILAMNLMGIIPLGASPSTNVNITASLAILVFLYAQYTGMRRLGFLGYLHHLAGSPTDITGWCLVPLMLPMHIIGELAKPFSLAIRLFGNITGEDILVAAFVGLGLAALSFVHSPVGAPLNVPFILLGILLSTIQALVFTLLSTIYILMMLPHGEH